MTHLFRTSSLRLALAASFLLALGLRSQADMNSINKDIWKLKYGVTDAQLADSVWMNSDSDGDGVKNKDEIAAGTNPFSASATINVSNVDVVSSPGNVILSFPTQNGKLYRAECATSLTAPTWTLQPQPTPVQVTGTGATLSLTVPYTANCFYRIRVDDKDTDGDGVSDWAEKVAGFNPNLAATGKDANGADVPDATAITAAITSSNVVTVSVTKADATQPPDAATAAVNTGSITISRSGPLTFSTINVPLQKAGSASEGVDYDALNSSATFLPGVSKVILPINPKFNGGRKTNVTAVVKALSGLGYTLGGATSGSVVINPTGQPNGTGLTAKYQNTSSATYATQQTFFSGTPEMTRIDPVIDFGTTSNTIVAGIALGSPSCVVTTTRDTALTTGDSVTIASVTGGTFSPTINGTYVVTVIDSTHFSVPVACTVVPTSVASATITAPNGWATATGPRGMSPQASTGAYSVRWTGQILPQYSETYSIDFRSDDGAKVWVNNVLLIDRWVAQGATDYTNTINLTAGVLYDIVIEYFNGATGASEAKLYWWSASQTRQIIPMNRLFPEPTLAQKFTAITNTQNAVGYTGVPFSFTVTAPDISGTVTYSLDSNSGPLPPGLGPIVASTGVITGTPTVAGAYNVAFNATNSAAAAITGSSVVNFTIYPTGGVSREVLGVASGPNVSNIVLPSGTPTHDTIATIDEDVDYAANTGERLRGYLVPPKTGNYYFWLAANNNAELWISNDSESVNKVRHASVTASTGKYTWNTSPTTQRTPWLALVAGQKYYFEVLHNKGPAGDHYVEVGWCQDDVGTIISVAGAPNATGAKTLIPNGAAATLSGYPLSGTVPGYIFQPYDYPTTVVVSGDLYGGNLGPQGSANTKASGSATLRTNAPGNAATSAILHFNYSNLSTPRTAYHLHTDAFATHPAGEIIFDIDDIDRFHPEDITADGGYIWNFAAVGTFTSVQQIRDAIAQGKVYLNVHSVSVPAGEIRGNLTVINGSQTPPDATLYPEPSATDVANNDANAARFLNQATFGAGPTDVTYVKNNGFSAWIDDQLTKMPTRVSNEVVANIGADINQPYPSALFTNAWWKASITGQDQLRQRLAFALSEIMVVSWANDSGPLAFNGRILADYYDNLVDYCLPTSGLTDSGTFRGILKNVTLTPAMGLYLDMRGNQKGDDTLGRHPNENYAREIMQLFSVGINRVWDDGKFVLNANADVVATYTQPSILGVSALLTGWNYAQPLQGSGRLPTSFGPAADYLNPMILVPLQHDLGKKLLLNNVVTPAATGVTPRVSISSITTTGGCTVNTSTVHGLKVNDTVMIAGVTTGTFTGGLTAINTTLKVTGVSSATAFTVPVTCTAAAGAAGTVTGATVIPAAYAGTTTGIAAVTGSQADNAGSTVPHPYDQYGLTELDTAIDNIVANDNVPPYICRQLIQRLVTSNPSPGYLYRVVQKFKNNGAGVRGDLAAVVRQILLDGEARSTTAAFSNVAFGKQREPMLRLTGPARAFPATPYTGTYTQLPANTVNANKLRIVTNTPNDFNAGFTVALNFQGNYTTTVPPSPYTNPTSTSYGIAGTSAIASTYLDISTIGSGGASTTITCSQPHGLGAIGQTRTVWFFGLSGKFSDASINSGGKTATVTGTNTFTVTATNSSVFQIASVSVGSPCTVTTVNPHGLPAGNTTLVTINGVNGGAFTGGSTSINGTNLTVTNTGANTFTVATSGGAAINCTSPPTSYTTWRQCSNPVRVTTAGPHGLVDGDSVTISGVSGGSFTPTINGTYSVSGINALTPDFTPSSFTLADISCASPSTVNTGNIVGGNTLDVSATGMVNVTYTQPAGSNVMTVMTGGPQTDVAIPVPNSATTTLKSKVYLDVLTRNSTAAIASVGLGNPCTVTTSTNHGLTTGDTVTIASVSGGTFSPTINGVYTVTVVNGTQFTVLSNCTVIPTAATGTVTGSYGATPTDGVYDVQTVNGSTSFTVFTSDTPTAARNGNVIVPKITTSYTPVSSNNVVQYNCNVNHNLLTGDHFWVDVPVVGTPVTDAEYIVSAPITGSGILPVDEDHLQTSYLPVSSGLGTYPKPSGSNNSVTIYPLVAPPMGRSGSVVVNQSTFVLNSTESTLTQSPLNAPTVFNYYLPYYKFPGALSNHGIDSPEFQITTDTNISNLTNSIANMFIGTGGGNGNLNGLSSFNNGSGSVVMDIGNFATLLKTQDSTAIGNLIDELANLLVGAPLESTTKAIIQNFVAYKKPITSISQASPCVVTVANHGLTTGNQIAINDVTGGTFSGGSTSINGSWIVTVLTPNTFTLGTVATTPVAENCTANGTIVYTNANIWNFPMNIPSPGPTNLQKRDRVRAIIHLILTSAEYAVQK